MDLDLAIRKFHESIAIGGSGAHEAAVYGPLSEALRALCPRGLTVAVLDAPGSRTPDISLLNGPEAAVAFVEVKLPTTLRDAFVVRGDGTHQIGRYRKDFPGTTIFLTDSSRWWDVTETDSLERPFTTIDPDDPTPHPEIRLLADRLALTAGKRPQYRSADAAAVGIASVVESFNANAGDEVTSGWKLVREGLGLVLTDNVLDSAGPGEVIAFSLLSLAISLDPLNDNTFVRDGIEEWNDTVRWNAPNLPSTLQQTFRAFRNHAQASGVIPPDAWVTIRSIARWIQHTDRNEMWTRLSSLWDVHLHRTGRRQSLGSWQTPSGVAEYQVRQTELALTELGYLGFRDPKVTVVDPCVGTGVYLSSIVDSLVAQGLPPEAINVSNTNPHPRLLGVDISSTAVATTHIRLAAQGAAPRVHLTDTLATGVSGSARPLFTDPVGGYNSIVGAASGDHQSVNEWAQRDAGRPPVIAIIGNPPYERAGLVQDRYADLGWMADVFDTWGRGSGGRGNLHDPYVAFWAWAFELCRRSHPDVPAGPGSTLIDGRPFGVVSFISNRSWIDGDATAPMRAWVSKRASTISITDFGPGSRAGGAGSWSEQPFAIETGTAIVTVTFDADRDPDDDASITYRRGVWADGKVSASAPQQIEISRFVAAQARNRRESDAMGDRPWTPQEEFRSLLEGSTAVNGIKTGEDQRWIRLIPDQSFSTRHAYRPFDNRWSPTTPPPKAQRGVSPGPGEAKPSADWRKSKLFDPHVKHIAAGGWYAVMQAHGAKPGPAVHPTRRLPDYHWFKGSEGGKVIRVSSNSPVPTAYAVWAEANSLNGDTFWKYAVAATHHVGYWTDGHPFAEQLATKRVEVPLSDDTTAVAALVVLGGELIDVWTVDDIAPAPHRRANGTWEFDGEDDAGLVDVNGRDVLGRWCRDRVDRPDWDERTSTEYARVIASINRAVEISREVADLLGPAGDE